MAGNNPFQAVQHFLANLNKALSCVTKDVLKPPPGGNIPQATPHVLTLPQGHPARLKSNPALLMSITIHYRIVYLQEDQTRGPWKVSTSGYLYRLNTRDGTELLSYHWHPELTPDKLFPHLHLGYGSNVQEHLRKAHLPTGRVSLEEIIRFVITELGVKPLPERRRDWWKILQQTQKVFEE